MEVVQERSPLQERARGSKSEEEEPQPVARKPKEEQEQEKQEKELPSELADAHVVSVQLK